MGRFEIPGGFVSTITPALGYEVHCFHSTADPANNSGNKILPAVPIIMIHGAIVSRRYLLPVAKVLANDYVIYVPDLPGHGASSKPKDALPVEEQAEIIHAWMQNLNIVKAVVLANSYGCEIAVELAVRYPETVERLILTGPASDPSAPTKFQQALRLFWDGVLENQRMYWVLFVDMLELGWHRGMQTTQIMIDYDYLPRLPLLKMKTLVARGENDPLAPQEWCEQVVSLIPDARLVVVPKGPHNINFSTPTELADHVARFLND